jgi:hypothetical protein
MKDGLPCHFCTGGKYRELRATGRPRCPRRSLDTVAGLVTKATSTSETPKLTLTHPQGQFGFIEEGIPKAFLE